MTTTTQVGSGPCTLKLLPCESLEQFNAFARSVWEHYQPETAYEEMLTNFVVITSWRHRRYLAMEESVLTEEWRIAEKRPSAEQDSPQDATAVLSTLVKDKEAAQSVKLVLRYVAAARRDANNAVANLKEAQRTRSRASVQDRDTSLEVASRVPVCASSVQQAQQERLARLTSESDSDQRLADGAELPLPVIETPVLETEETHLDVQPQISPEPVMALSRTERRALERRLRKAEKKALRNAPGHGEHRFVSHAA